MVRLVLAVVAAFLLNACRTTDPSAVTEATTTSLHLPDFDDTLLLSDSKGKVAVLKLGETVTATVGAEALDKYVTAGRSFGGKFVVLTAKGTLATIDPASAGIESSVSLAVDEVADIELESATVGYATSAKPARLVCFDPGTGQAVSSIDLTALAPAGGKAIPSRMLRVGDRMIVQVQRENAQEKPQRGAVVVVDLQAQSVAKVVEIEGVNPANQQVIPGLSPDGAMVLDAARNRVFITAKGMRPSNTGMIVALSLETLALESKIYKAMSGFQGPIVLSGVSDDAYLGYHTSTPVDSTHLFHYKVGEDGTLKSVGGGTLVDAFEVLPDFPWNQARTLLAFPVSCPVGFCVGGKGVSFVELKAGKVHPRLPATELGIAPSFALFL